MSERAFNLGPPDFALGVISHAPWPSRELLLDAVREGGPEDVYVKTSPVHGQGVFARRTFATGETILVREEQPVSEQLLLDAAPGESVDFYDRVEGGSQVLLGFPARHINHSCDPNAFQRRREGISYIVALKPIRPNEEIVEHYGVNRAGRSSWTCNCGSQRCIGTLPGSFFDLPLEIQVELSPLLAKWFVFEHRDRYRAFLAAAGLSEDEVS